MGFHEPVMLEEVVRGVVHDRAGIYLDATAGGGGHSLGILQQLGEAGRVISVDRDKDAVAAARQRLAAYGERSKVLHGSFDQLADLLRSEGVEGLHGALFDLGVSSHQIDAAQRGFSYQREGPLDMRMDRGQEAVAADLLHDLPEGDLARLIAQYGEDRQARRLARSICQWRSQQALRTTADLRSAIERTRPSNLPKTLARVFQALRIAVNDELGQLQRGLDGAIALLWPQGRLAVIAYHSLEDRLVKRKFASLVRGCICPPALPVCACGRQPSFAKYSRRPLRASQMEVNRNRRARSAVLRIYEKVGSLAE